MIAQTIFGLFQLLEAPLRKVSAIVLEPSTIEYGVVRICDISDMNKG